MSTLLGIGLLLVGCLALASIPVSLFLGAVIRLAKDPRPAQPPAAVAGRVRPVGAARGFLAAPSARRGPRRMYSPPLVLVPGGGEGPADPNSAGPANSTP